MPSTDFWKAAWSDALAAGWPYSRAHAQSSRFEYRSRHRPDVRPFRALPYVFACDAVLLFQGRIPAISPITFTSSVLAGITILALEERAASTAMSLRRK